MITKAYHVQPQGSYDFLLTSTLHLAPKAKQVIHSFDSREFHYTSTPGELKSGLCRTYQAQIFQANPTMHNKIYARDS
jgi:hypothetical protein